MGLGTAAKTKRRRVSRPVALVATALLVFGMVALASGHMRGFVGSYGQAQHDYQPDLYGSYNPY